MSGEAQAPDLPSIWPAEVVFGSSMSVCPHTNSATVGGVVLVRHTKSSCLRRGIMEPVRVTGLSDLSAPLDFNLHQVKMDFLLGQF